MTQTAAPAASPAGAPPRRRARRRIWPRVLIALGVVLVLLAGAAGAYLLTIDRSVTSNLNRGVELPGDDPLAPPGLRNNCSRAPMGSIRKLMPIYRAQTE